MFSYMRSHYSAFEFIVTCHLRTRITEDLALKANLNTVECKLEDSMLSGVAFNGFDSYILGHSDFVLDFLLPNL